MVRSILSPIFLIFLMLTTAVNSLNEVFRWKFLDFKFPNDNIRQDEVNHGEFEPYNNIPMGLEVWRNKIFITVPRWKYGVAASLAYIYLTDTEESPKLRPYPNWNWHRRLYGPFPKIVSPFRVRADSCDRLWVIDSGYNTILGSSVGTKPRLLIFDLKTDELLRNYTIPDDQFVVDRNLFCNIVVEENNCVDSFAYLSDLSHPGMVVYSYEKHRSWLVQHNYFGLDPFAANMTVAGINFQWEDGLFGMALSEPRENGYSSLYFHPMLSFYEFNVSTKVLRDKELVQNKSELDHHFKMLGSRGPRSQGGSSFYHKKSKVLFYALLQLNGVACWRTTNQKYTEEFQGRIFTNNTTMIFPSDLKVDHNDTLWVFSNKLPIYMFSNLDFTDYNFRILNQTVNDAIRGTACDPKFVMNKSLLKDMVKGNSEGVKIMSNSFVSILLFVLCAISFR